MRRDVLILGGGPAGGLAALLYARAGRRVVLCEAHAGAPAARLRHVPVPGRAWRCWSGSACASGWRRARGNCAAW